MGANILHALNCYFQSWKTEIFTEKYKKIAITTAEEVQIFLHFFYNFQNMQRDMIIFGCRPQIRLENYEYNTNNSLAL